MAAPRPFCALCTRDILGKPRSRPLGKGGGMVNVCAPCDGEHPRQGRYAFNGSETPSRSGQRSKTPVRQ